MNPGVVDVVIVSYNTQHLTVATVDRMRGLREVSSVSVFDNASADGSGEALQSHVEDGYLIRSTTNLGFAAAVNRLLPLGEAPYVLLLNPDCVIDGAALLELVRHLVEHPLTGVVAPAVYRSEDRAGVLSAGAQPSCWTVLTHYSGLSRFSHRCAALSGLNLLAGMHDDRPRVVGWVSGACMLVRREVMVELGGLSQRWFMYAEDMDFCDRVSRAGLMVEHLPTAVAFHQVGASGRPDGSMRPWTLWVENLVDFYLMRVSPGPLRGGLFRLLLSTGLASRALMAAVLPRRRANAVGRAHEVKRWLFYAAAAWR